MENIIALIMAAGKGERLNSRVPKQYLTLGGTTILARTINLFASHPKITQIQVVISESHLDLYQQTCQELTPANLAKLLPPSYGSVERQESVRLGLQALATTPPSKILIQDAARPFTSAALITAAILALEHSDAVIPGISVVDTLKSAQDHIVTGTTPRDNLYVVQTPQAFRYNLIRDVHESLKGKGISDDAGLCEIMNLPVRMIKGERTNFKITTEEDMAQAQQIIERKEYRTGSGFDAHRFGDAAPGIHTIWLAGVEVESTKPILAHSDGDVAMHALVDAMLGSISAGDIGKHFPPSDPKWRGADSALFLCHANDLLKAASARIVNIDITIICESPKIGPHRERMTSRIAELLNIAPELVSIKATTTEKMGFTGRGEGIAVQAVVSVEVPLLLP